MTEIPLTQCKVALVDDEDAFRVAAYKWHATRCHDTGRYYAARTEGSSVVYLHRFILSASDNVQVDHINRDGLDNRRLNLRRATPSQNQWNSGRRIDSQTGFKGVCFDRKHQKFRAQIQRHGVKRQLGRFLTAIEAARVYDAAAVLLHGEFARINFPENLELIRRMLEGINVDQAA